LRGPIPDFAEPLTIKSVFVTYHGSVMKRIFLHFGVVVPLVALLAAGPATEPAVQFNRAIAPREWSFPRDHGRHDGFKLEWWYFTGNLHDSSGRKFGYQLTFFRSAFAPAATPRSSAWAMNDIYFAHAAISDIAANRFHFKDRLERARPGLAFSSDETMDVSLLDWSAKLDAETIELKSTEKDFAIDLQCDQGGGPILEGPGGVNAKGREPGQASYYYSMTRLKTAGMLKLNGQSFHVNGLSWMDHEFSSDAMAKNQVGWDWMGLQLNDGSDLMIYRMRSKDGSSDYLSGTRITADGRAHFLSQDQLTITGSSPWKSATSGAEYPQKWSVAVAGYPTLLVSSEMPEQELITTASTKVDYFEGAASVTTVDGKPAGEGYLEMTGYAK
jgi:predicted secreted hydrolase